MERKNVWKTYSEEQLKAADVFGKEYMYFLDHGKTERECVDLTVEMARAAGYKSLEEVLADGKALNAGDKVYAVCMGKTIALFQMGHNKLIYPIH